MDLKALAEALKFFPDYVSRSVILLTIAILLGPKILELLNEAASWYRGYHKEKQYLELLKLRYEIAALKKEKGLEDLPGPTLLEQPIRVYPERSAAPTPPKTISGGKRFLLGLLGGFVPALVIVLLSSQAVLPGGSFAEYVALYALFVIPFPILAGLATMVLLGERQTALACLFVGTSVVLAFRMALTSIIEQVINGPIRP